MHNRHELDALFSATYEELRRLAATLRRDRPADTLNPTALVNEAWVKLARSAFSPPASRLHFKRVAAGAMRQVLVDAARRRKARKRGGSDVFVTLNDHIEAAPAGSDRLLRLDAALERLARISPRQARVVEYRFFGGYDVAETAALLEVSEATVARDWRAARAWLAAETQDAV